MKKILFIVHEATRTGAPIVILSLLHWLKQNGNVGFDILLLEDGPLRKEFEEIAKTYITPHEYKYQLFNKAIKKLYPGLLEYKVDKVVKKLGKKKYTLIYGNTIVTLPWLLKFKKNSDLKVVCAIHELSYILEYHFTKEFIQKELPKIDLIIAGSHAVAENLIKEFNTPKEKIRVVHAFIETNFKINKSIKTLKQELGIENTEFVIGGLGSPDLRKGTDLIIPLAKELKNKYPDVLFKIIWVGGFSKSLFIKTLKQDAKKCGVEDKVIFIDNTSYPDDYINLYDVFTLLSREDPFPLVLLTAAAMQKALIAFDKSGGAPELLNDGAGFIAPYLDIEAVAKIISTLYYNRDMIDEAGKKAKEKVEREFSAKVIPARVLKMLQEL